MGGRLTVCPTVNLPPRVFMLLEDADYLSGAPMARDRVVREVVVRSQEHLEHWVLKGADAATHILRLIEKAPLQLEGSHLHPNQVRVPAFSER